MLVGIIFNYVYRWVVCPLFIKGPLPYHICHMPTSTSRPIRYWLWRLKATLSTIQNSRFLCLQPSSQSCWEFRIKSFFEGNSPTNLWIRSKHCSNGTLDFTNKAWKVYGSLIRYENWGICHHRVKNGLETLLKNRSLSKLQTPFTHINRAKLFTENSAMARLGYP